MTTTAIWALAPLAPYQALLAAAVRVALEDALGGDGQALEWLAGEQCTAWLAELLPADALDLAVATVQQELLAAATGTRTQGAERLRQRARRAETRQRETAPRDVSRSYRR